MMRDAIKNVVREDNFEIDTTHLCSLVALQCGIIKVILGILDAGILANMLSQSVITGFTFSAALLICRTQFEELLGLTGLSKDCSFFETIYEVIIKFDRVHVPTATMSIVIVSLLLLYN